ncbi:hypothetical protein MASR2M29_23550 [Spirochaetota bacterium]
MLVDEHGLVYIQQGESFKKCAAEMAAHGYDEFAIYPEVSCDSVSKAALAGFMPMGISLKTPHGCMDFLLPKLHFKRCILCPSDMHTSRTAKRNASRYALSISSCFGHVLDACVNTHGDGWLVPKLRTAFRKLHAGEKGPLRLLSAELWDMTEEEAIYPCAGEIGYAIGSSYTSLSGYRTRSGSGTVQLFALGAFLAMAGYSCWDLGMELPYKMAIGASLLPREEYIPILEAAYARDSAFSGKWIETFAIAHPVKDLVSDFKAATISGII